MLAVVGGLAFAAGCGGGDPWSWRHVDSAVISTPNVVIEAENHDFRLVSGAPFPTPFVAYDCPGQPTAANFALGERLGGQRVRVHVPQLHQPLYGILSFCWIHPSVTGPITRTYDLRIPDQYVQDTDGGRVSFVAEPSGYQIAYQDGSFDVPAWILWLSRSPFPRSSGGS